MSVCLGRSYKKDCNHAEDFLFKIMHRLTGFEGNTKAFCWTQGTTFTFMQLLGLRKLFSLLVVWGNKCLLFHLLFYWQNFESPV